MRKRINKVVYDYWVNLEKDLYPNARKINTKSIRTCVSGRTQLKSKRSHKTLNKEK